MNPMTNIKNVIKLSEQELRTSNKTSWHDQYRDSAWLFIGGLPYDLTEGDIICVFSQYGEIVTINLIRDKDTGKQKGFCFLCYEDQRSTDLAVDNLNGIKILNRTIRVDHVANYKVPKESRDKVAQIKKYEEKEEDIEEPPPVELPIKKPVVKTEPLDMPSTRMGFKSEITTDDIKLPPRLPIYPIKEENASVKTKSSKKKKEKKEKRKKKDKKRKHSKRGSSSDDDVGSSNHSSFSDGDFKSKRRRNSEERRNSGLD